MRAHMKRRHSRGSFTLIELLIVLVIIGILVTLAAPKYTQYVNNSKSAEPMVNLRALAKALNAYLLESGAFPGAQPANAIPPNLGVTVLSKTRFWQYTYTVDLAPPAKYCVIADRLNRSGTITTGEFPVGTTTEFYVLFNSNTAVIGTDRGQPISNSFYVYYCKNIKTSSGFDTKYSGW